MCVCVCVFGEVGWGCERECVCVGVQESVFVCMWVGERVGVCGYGCARERECVCVL